MDSNETSDLMEFIALTFNKPLPSSTKLGFYHEELWQLDAGALDYIRNYFSGLDSCPSNIVKAVKAAYSDWTGTRPEYSRQTVCITCNGYGLLIREERDQADGQLYSYTGRCGHCENWRRHTGEQTPVAQPDKYQYKKNGSMPGKAA